MAPWVQILLPPVVVEQARALGGAAEFPLASQVAANTEAAKSFKLPITVEHGQTRHFDRQTLVDIIERPKQDDAAESFPSCQCACDLGLRVEAQALGDLDPIAVEYGAVFVPRSSANSWFARLKQVSASVCQTNRKGTRCSMLNSARFRYCLAVSREGAGAARRPISSTV